MKKGILIVPNLLTTANMFCGFYAIIAVFNGSYYKAALAILLALLFDGMDGRVARLTKSSSDFGLEYDSLADLLSFGFAPGLLLYSWALQPFGRIGWLASFLFVVCGALRLARFNVQVRDRSNPDFVGLPIPAAAAAIASIVILAKDYVDLGETRPLVVAVVAYGLACLMVSTIRYRSLKHLELRRRKPFNLLVVAVLLFYVVASIPQIAIFLIFISYVFSGPIEALLTLCRFKIGEIDEAVEVPEE